MVRSGPGLNTIPGSGVTLRCVQSLCSGGFLLRFSGRPQTLSSLRKTPVIVASETVRFKAWTAAANAGGTVSGAQSAEVASPCGDTVTRPPNRVTKRRHALQVLTCRSSAGKAARKKASKRPSAVVVKSDALPAVAAAKRPRTDARKTSLGSMSGPGWATGADVMRLSLATRPLPGRSEGKK